MHTNSGCPPNDPCDLSTPLEVVRVQGSPFSMEKQGRLPRTSCIMGQRVREVGKLKPIGGGIANVRRGYLLLKELVQPLESTSLYPKLSDLAIGRLKER